MPISLEASIIVVGSDEFDELTVRWTAWAAPSFRATVQVYTEEDVSNTIKVSNKYELPWLAVSGRHGGIRSLGKLDSGVQINMDHLDSLVISSDGKTATIGGGMLSGEVTSALWDKGKWTTTGSCECTSLVGPMLGGGHGFLQGRYGLALDNLASARVALGNGTVVTASDKTNADLFWALRGAGHNFGIVTEVEYRIHDVPSSNKWMFADMFFTADKVEEVFAATNKIAEGFQPIEIVSFIEYRNLPDIDPNNPVIELLLFSEGTAEEAEQYLSLYRAIGPKNSTVVGTEYPEFSKHMRFSKQDPACLEGQLTVQRFPANLELYNIATQKELLVKFGDLVAANPFLGNSFYIFENYGYIAVKDVPDESTAYPDRFNGYLIAPCLIYTNSTPENDEIARQGGEELRSIAVGGREDGKLYAYVNYANGYETLEELYGHDPWRLEKLRSTKKAYDPDSRLRFYAPIV
ncbi:FAD binding domain protein [Diaporthe sp. PMI_573]|nr:FAD binding domain protein [Diaporthaceae sp. PMI_573]